MLLEIGAGLALLAGGFGLGRVKNAGKLAAIKAEVTKVESDIASGAKKLAADAETEVKKLIAAVKSHL